MSVEVKHPKYYNQYDIEVLEMMERIWGSKAVAIFCKLNAFKYRMRAGLKTEVPSIDYKKEREYLELYEKYNNKVKDSDVKSSQFDYKRAVNEMLIFKPNNFAEEMLAGYNVLRKDIDSKSYALGVKDAYNHIVKVVRAELLKGN